MHIHFKLCVYMLAGGMMIPLTGCNQPANPPASATPTPPASPSTTPALPESSATTPAPQPPAATPPPAGTSADAQVDAQITNVLGGAPKAYHAVFDNLQKAMAAGDKDGVAALVAYPLEVTVQGKKQRIAGAQELVANWDKVVTPDIVKAVADQKFSTAMVNQDGLMLGDGQVWISGVCRDTACKVSDVRITAIQPGPK